METHMTKAQTAWAVLTAMFIAASIVLLTVPTTQHPVAFATVCIVVGVVGWLALGLMIFNDNRT